jgi:hypothetical protein
MLGAFRLLTLGLLRWRSHPETAWRDPEEGDGKLGRLAIGNTISNYL